MLPTALMPKTISSTEAKSRLDALLKWVGEYREKVIVTRDGHPIAVVISYAEFEEVEKLIKREQKRQALEALDALRDEARLQNPELTTEEAYRLAGFSEEVIQETLRVDEALTATKR